MSADEGKKQAVSTLLAEGVDSDHPLSRWVYVLKKEGVPIISEPAGTKLRHKIIETALRPEEVIARRQRGLASAIRWQRHENPAAWARLLESMPCPFAKDEAADYLRGIVKRQKVVDSMQRRAA